MASIMAIAELARSRSRRLEGGDFFREVFGQHWTRVALDRSYQADKHSPLRKVARLPRHYCFLRLRVHQALHS